MAKQKKQTDITQAYRTGYLLSGHIRGTLTEAEQTELSNWRAESNHNEELFQRLTNPANLKEWAEEYQQVETEGYLAQTKLQMRQISRKHRLRLLGYVAAASIIVAYLTVFVMVPYLKDQKETSIAQQHVNDLPPGLQQAQLKVNNHVIALSKNIKDTTVSGSLSIHANDGLLTYSNNDGTVEWHELSVPVKGTFQLLLPDGSKVWLNASSSIRYPTRFTGAERKVEVIGEAYFEVAPDKFHPFRVAVNGAVVEAVGTAFNINAYPDEGNLVTTLIEGKVKLSSSNDTVFLSPNHSASLMKDGWMIQDATTSEITGWKNNQFVFSNTPLPVIMRQLARWYGATIHYTNPVNVQLNGTISRGMPLSKILSILSKTEAVHFRIEGTQIYVMK